MVSRRLVKLRVRARDRSRERVASGRARDRVRERVASGAASESHFPPAPSVLARVRAHVRTYVRAYVRTYGRFYRTYVRTYLLSLLRSRTHVRARARASMLPPRRPPLLAACARTRACARVVRAYACAPSPEKERDMVPSRHARTRVRTDVHVRTYPVALPLSLRAHARAYARELYVRMRAFPARRKREIWCPLAMHVRAYARTYTYVRTYAFRAQEMPPPARRAIQSQSSQPNFYVRTYVSNPPSRTGTGYQFGHATAHATSAGRFARHLVASTVGLHNDQLPLSHG